MLNPTVQSTPWGINSHILPGCAIEPAQEALHSSEKFSDRKEEEPSLGILQNTVKLCTCEDFLGSSRVNSHPENKNKRKRGGEHVKDGALHISVCVGEEGCGWQRLDLRSPL